MLTMAKIVGDLLQGYSLKIAGVICAFYVGDMVYDLLTHVADPISKGMGGQ